MLALCIIEQATQIMKTLEYIYCLHCMISIIIKLAAISLLFNPFESFDDLWSQCDFLAYKSYGDLRSQYYSALYIFRGFKSDC
jgi:hypothetical protein